MRASALALALVGANGCGAKTGLRVPCEITLEPERPALVAIVDRSASGWTRYPTGESLYEAERRTIDDVFTPLQPVADFGAILAPAYFIGPQNCAAETPIVVPVESNTVPAILRATVESVQAPPLGASTVVPAISAAQQALRNVPPEQRFALLFYGGVYCEANHDSIVAAIRTAPFRTLVVWLTTLPSGALITQESQTSDMAVAGRLTNTRGPFPYYRLERLDELRTAIEEQVIQPARCTLRPSDPLETPAQWVLRREDGGFVPSSDEEGPTWSWSPERDRVLLHGATCAEIARSRQRVSLVQLENLCTL